MRRLLQNCFGVGIPDFKIGLWLWYQQNLSILNAICGVPFSRLADSWSDSPQAKTKPLEHWEAKRQIQMRFLEMTSPNNLWLSHYSSIIQFSFLGDFLKPLPAWLHVKTRPNTSHHISLITSTLRTCWVSCWESSSTRSMVKISTSLTSSPRPAAFVWLKSWWSQSTIYSLQSLLPNHLNLYGSFHCIIV